VREVHDEFDKLLRDRNHLGMRNLLGDAVLEPRNPFQNARRGAKRWVIAVGGIVLLGVLIFGYFHLR
jgi:cell division septal protein FtsQ